MNAIRQTTQTEAARRSKAARPATEAEIREFKKRMLAWRNPVEFVNNMYGCHPGDKGQEYFQDVFGE